MSYYWIGDKPVTALVFAPSRLGNPLGNTFTGVSAVLVKPNGVSAVVSDQVIYDPEDGTVAVQFAGESWFTVPGLYQLRCTLTAGDGVDQRTERLDAIQIVVHSDDGWHTLPSARSEWRDAPQGAAGDDVRLWTLLEVAKGQVLAFAEALPELAQPPLHYRQAQLLQARNIFNGSRVDPSSGDAGGDGYALTPFPLDWQVKQLLRPRRGIPVAL